MLVLVTVVAILVAVVQSSTFCPNPDNEGRGLLYPHMANNGDTEFIPRRDDAKKKLKIAGQYKLYGKKYNSKLYVWSNGILAMENGDLPFNPSKFAEKGTAFIAPAYSDVDIQNMPHGYEASHIWFRETDDAELLARFKTDMGRNLYRCGGKCFKPSRLIIVTWQRVQSYCDLHTRRSSKRDTDEDKSTYVDRSDEEKARAPQNTFQLVYATNLKGSRSFVMFNYKCLSWDNCWSYTRAGFNDGAGKTLEIANSGTSDFNTNDQNTNCGKPGRFLFRVDGNNLRAPSSC